MAQLAVEMTSDEMKLFRGMQKIIAQQKRMEDGFTKVGKRGKTVGGEIESSWDRARNQMVAFTGAMLGAGGLLAGLRLVSTEIQRQIDLQAKVAQTQITVQSARADLLRNLAAEPSSVQAGALGKASAIAGATGVPEQFVLLGLAQAFSASGGNLDAALASVSVASRFLADKPGSIGGFAGSLQDIAKVTGSGDAVTNLGFLARVGAQSRVVDPQAQAMNIPPALINQLPFGSTASGAAALFATLTSASGDIQGARSGTASVQLAEQLRGFFGDDQTTAQRILALQADPTRAQRFLRSASFEVKQKGVIEQLLTDPNSPVAQLFLANLASAPTLDVSATTGRDVLSNLATVDPLSRTAQLGRALSSAAEQIRIGDLSRGMGGVSRQGLGDLLDALGDGAIRKRFEQLVFEGGTGLGRNEQIDTLIDLMTRRMEQLLSNRQTISGGGPAGGFVRVIPDVVTDEERRIASVLEQLVQVLEQIRTDSPAGVDDPNVHN